MNSPLSQEPDLDHLGAQMRQLAEGKHLVVVPAMPLRDHNSRLLVMLGKEDMSASDFCDLAVAAGSRLLYMDADPFDADTELDPGVGDDDFEGYEDIKAKVEALREAAEPYSVVARRDCLSRTPVLGEVGCDEFIDVHLAGV